MKIRFSLVVPLFALAAALPVTTQAADLAAGKEKAAMCAGCHGADGRAANPAWPNLAGQNVDYLKAQLLAFKAGARKNDLMSPMAQALSDEDVENVAAWFSSLSPCK